jgi:Cd2+/Zn2+-exporting ATPase/Cu+-exporting ATPase
VAGIATLTYILRRDPLATAAVLVVACSCSFALATPIAMLASIGAGAKRGLMIKGGKYLESMAKADVLLIDKTGTLTLGKLQISDFQTIQGDVLSNVLNPEHGSEVLRLAASAERYSEHPLAEALREAARQQGLSLGEPLDFESLPGLGVRACVDGRTVLVGSRRLMEGYVSGRVDLDALEQGHRAAGQSLFFAAVDGNLAGLFTAVDTPRPEVPEALGQVRSLGIRQIEILTGDNEQAAQALVRSLGDGLELKVSANLLPEDKIRIVRQHQEQGLIVVMVGDGVNDAPALAQADAGIAMRSAGSAGSDLAVEAAHIVLMREDWRLVPGLLRIARRTMGVVKVNIAFTIVYNIVGLTLAALGFLPPGLAAAAQSLPDLGILANSSRLLRQKT